MLFALLTGGLFDAKDFVTRDCCGLWGPTLPTVYIISNLVIALAYYLIPLTLVWIYKARPTVMPQSWMLFLFAAFILLCGTTHLLNALAFTWPAYRFYTLVDVLTAAASLITAVILPVAAYHVTRLPTWEEYNLALQKAQGEAQAREAVLQNLQDRNRVLSAECDALRAEFERIKDREVTAAEYRRLREMLHRIRNGAAIPPE